MKKFTLVIAMILLAILVVSLTACDMLGANPDTNGDVTGDGDGGAVVPNPEEYKVTIHPNNGQDNADWKVTDPIPVFTYEGHTIEGFYLDGECTISVSLTSLQITGLTGNIDVYIKWKESCEHNVVTDQGKPATCTEDGLTDGSHCSKCNEVLVPQTVIPAGHTPAQAVVENRIAETCTEAGSFDKVVYCVECGREISRENKTIEPSHKIVEHEGQEETCTEDGWKPYETCSKCEYTTYETIPAQHKLVEHDAKDVTCTEVGWDAYVTCSRCDYSTYVEIPATGHSHTAVVTDPTCIEQGFTTHTCHCGDSYIDTYVDATGHTWGDWYETKAPTDTEAGEERRDCETCDCYETNVLPALGQSDLINGTWGSLTWTLNETTGELVISGEGKMDDFARDSTSAWREYKDIIKSVTIENGVTTIGYYAFAYCTSLTSIVIPDSVTTIVEEAFLVCSSLTSVVIPDSVTIIGYRAFYGCTSLTDVYYTGDIAGWCGISFNSFYANPMCCANNLYIAGELIEGELAIPDSVTSIGEAAFRGCDSLTSVTIGNSVTTIGNYAFYECSSLTSVTIGENSQLTSIGEGAFIYCSSLTSVTFDENSQLTTICNYAFQSCTGLISITIPDSVTTIGEAAFRGCDSLTSVTIGNSVTTIGMSALSRCSSLTSITIPNSVTTIGAWAFSDCDSLTSVTFGENSQLTTIGNYAFYECSSLISITIPASVTSIGNSAFSYCYALAEVYNYSSLNITKGSSDYGYIAYYALDVYTTNEPSKLTTDENGFVIHTNGEVKTLVGYIGTATEITIPDNVTIIGNYAFYDCNLTSVTIPNSVTSIGLYAFSSCRSLTSITIPARVTTIGGSAFSGCSSLTSITIPNSVTTIGNYAFSSCTSLTSVTFGENSKLTTIGDYAFYDCSSLTDVYYTGTEEQWNAISIGSYNNKLLNVTIHFLGEDEAPALINGTWGSLTWTLNETTGELVISGTGEMDAFTYDSTSAWREYKDIIKSVTIENGVTTIGKSAFDVCDRLTSIVIPDSVTTIGPYAFRVCTSLTSIVIPDSVTTIGTYAFRDCTNLTSVIFGENSKLTTIGPRAFRDCDSLTSIVIPDSVIAIVDWAFQGCNSLTSITIPDSVTTIGYDAFKDCDSLTYYTYDNAKYLGNESNPYLVLVKATSTSITSCEINENCKIISSSAFYNCDSLTSIIIPDSVTTIGYDAFYNCDSLTYNAYNNAKYLGNADNPYLVLVGATSTSITSCEINENCKIISSDAFRYCRSLTSIDIPNSVTSIGKGAFRECSSLTSVTFGENSQLTTIGDYAFYECSSLTSVTIGNGVTTIGYNAFSNCDSLTSVTCGENSQLTTIGDAAFYLCENLTSIIIPDSVTTIGDAAFEYCYKLVEVYNKSSLNITKGSTNNGYVGYYALKVYTEEYVSKLSIDEDGYIIYNDGVDKILVGYTGDQTELVIPDGITGINGHAFYECSSLTSIVIPDSVTTIGQYAFYNCTSLTDVYYTGTEEQWNNITIGSYNDALINATIHFNYTGEEGGDDQGSIGLKYTLSEDETYYTVSGIGDCTDTDVVIPSTYNGLPVMEIGSCAFDGCDSLTNVTIPDSVTTIGGYAFYGCSSLTSVTFGENSQLTTIGERAFYYCTNLTSITIPDSVTTIGSDAFYYCTGLTSITIPDSVTTIGVRVFICCTSLASIEVDEDNPNYQSIDGSIYSKDGKTLVYYAPGKTETTFAIPDSVTTIGERAFQDCHSLISITIPSSVTTIGNSAFYSCSSLTSIVISDSVTTIDRQTFKYCHSLTSVTIGNSVTTIGDGAFYGCGKLVEVYNKSNLNITKGSTDNGYVGYCALNVYTEEGGSKLSTDENGYIIYTDGADKILVGYTGTDTDLVVPDGITEIYKYAFYSCSSLTSIVIPSNVTTIGSYAFQYCDSLTSVTFDENSQLTTIGEYAFYSCSSLTSIDIPDSVTTIGDDAFWDCTSLTSVTIGNSVTTIGDGAFRDCTSLTSVTFGENSQLTTIGSSAFSGCSSLTSINIPDGVTTIGEGAFYGCDKLVEVYNKSNLNITKGSTDNGYVGYNALNVYTPSSGSSKLSTDQDGYIIYTDGTDKILIGYVGAETDLVVPDGITEIYKYAFYRCDSLTSIVIPDSVTTIGEWAFYRCDSLTSVTIGDSVTTIGDDAFSWCNSLTSIIIPESVTTIGDDAFYICTSLTDVYYTGTKEQWKAISIGSYNTKLTNATIHYNYTGEEN